MARFDQQVDFIVDPLGNAEDVRHRKEVGSAQPVRRWRPQSSGASGWNACFEILAGAAVAILGIVDTVQSYEKAVKAGGGEYIIYAGAIITGAIMLFRGCGRLSDGE